jgi:hypothetical protein
MDILNNKCFKPKKPRVTSSRPLEKQITNSNYFGKTVIFYFQNSILPKVVFWFD